MCPFVTADGCRVYQNRPSSCRMYPLIRVVRRARADGGKQFSTPFCMNPIARI
ncbi:MAG: YkgJ family cysteine cluster protein [Desulfobacterales bacterium]